MRLLRCSRRRFDNETVDYPQLDAAPAPCVVHLVTGTLHGRVPKRWYGPLVVVFALALLFAQTPASAAGAPTTANRRLTSPTASWQGWDGGARIEGDFTDVATVPVGGRVELTFERPVLTTVCDDPLVRIEPLTASYVLVGVREGTTQCGFWMTPGGAPTRYLRITVFRDTKEARDK